MLEKTTPLKFYLFCFLIVFVGFYQLTFFIHTVKYDAIDYFFPGRFYIGECLQAFKLPLWNPHQDLGYPIHADPQSGAWYPVVWIIGFFHSYTLYTIGFEYWIHVFFAGIGFYKLCKTLQLKQEVAQISAVCYMLCGVFVGNAQHLTYIISACWVPFVINYYLKMNLEKGMLNALKASICMFLIITGGYPAFTIILFYLLLLFFTVELFNRIKTKQIQSIINLFAINGVFLFVTLAMSTVILMSVYQVFPYMSRLGKFELAEALFSPFSPMAFISFLLPYATTIDPFYYFNSDLSMVNGYFGVVMLLFTLLGLTVKKTKPISILFFFALFSMLVSVGEHLPIRAFLFNHIPMMNLFRFPSIFRLFSIIGFLVIGANYLQTIYEKELFFRNRKLIIGSIIGIALFTGFIVFSFVQSPISLKELFKTVTNTNVTDNKEIWKHIMFQSLLQVLILSGLLFTIFNVKKIKQSFFILLLLVTVDLVLATQLNAPYTIYETVSASAANANLKKYPKGFNTIPSLTIDEADHQPGIGTPFWRNVAIFQKHISAEGFNPFSFSEYENLENNTPFICSQIKKNRVLLLSDTILNEKNKYECEKDSSFKSNYLFFQENDYNTLRQVTMKHSKNDTAIVTSYSPNNFEIKVNSTYTQILTLHQKKYNGWKAFINEKETEVYLSNNNFMSVVIPKGYSKISFRYNNPIITSSFLITISTFLLSFIIICYCLFFSKTQPKV